MADFITQFAADEGVSRDNFNSRISEANTALTTVEGKAHAAQSTANTAVSNAAAAQTTANTAVTNAATAQSGVNAINSAKGAASGIATLDGSSKVTAAQASATVQTKTASATLALADEGKFTYVNSTSALTMTIPANATVAFPIGTEMEFCRYNTGTVTFAAASGATLLSVDSVKTIGNRYGCVALKKILVNTWLLSGDLG